MAKLSAFGLDVTLFCPLRFGPNKTLLFLLTGVPSNPNLLYYGKLD